MVVSKRLGFFHGNDAVLADLVHGFGDDLADGYLVVGRDGADLGDHLARNFLAHLLEIGDHVLHAGIDPFLDQGRIGAGGDHFQAFAVDALGQYRGGSGAVSGYIRGLGSHFLDHLRSHVFLGILQIDLLGNGHAVLGDGRRTEFLFQNDVASTRTQRCLHCIGQLVDPIKDRLPGIFT